MIYFNSSCIMHVFSVSYMLVINIHTLFDNLQKMNAILFKSCIVIVLEAIKIFCRILCKIKLFDLFLDSHIGSKIY